MGTGNKSGARGQGPGSGRTAIFYITENGHNLARQLTKHYPDAEVVKFSPKAVPGLWNKCRFLIFIMASGIVVRTIAPLIKDKKTDPAVVVLDEKGKHAISLLSGHLGGANDLAREIAGHTGGDEVITTASDVNGLPSIDLWAEKNHLVVENERVLPRIAAKLINRGSLKVYTEQDATINIPCEFMKVNDLEDADIVITNKFRTATNVTPAQTGIQKKAKNRLDSCFRRNDKNTQQLLLRPKNLIVGIGCNSGTSAMEIESAVKRVLKRHGLSFHSIHALGTIDKKAGEPGLKTFAGKYSFKLHTFTPEELNLAVSRQPSAFSLSKAALKATGAYAVSEPAALLASGGDSLLVQKQKAGNVTVAVAEHRAQSTEHRLRQIKSKLKAHNSKLFVVGTGPGSIEHITPYAQEAIRKSDVVVGYGTYIDLIKDLLTEKEVVSTGMTQEVDRCRKAVELALQGKTVSVISGGDPGIYAMAGLVFEILKGQGKRAFNSTAPCPLPLAPDVEVIPGISALNACAARLGAPLMHDFASISLSDRLTPWDLIEKRLAAAAEADFVIALYNPKSKGRPDRIDKAQKIILKYRDLKTPVGIVKGAMRDNEEITITTLGKMSDCDIDMQTTVIIGNSRTFVWKDRLVTPRGYEKKFKI